MIVGSFHSYWPGRLRFGKVVPFGKIAATVLPSLWHKLSAKITQFSLSATSVKFLPTKHSLIWERFYSKGFHVRLHTALFCSYRARHCWTQFSILFPALIQSPVSLHVYAVTFFPFPATIISWYIAFSSNAHNLSLLRSSRHLKEQSQRCRSHSPHVLKNFFFMCFTKCNR